jgi:hypothetical protein
MSKGCACGTQGDSLLSERGSWDKMAISCTSGDCALDAGIIGRVGAEGSNEPSNRNPKHLPVASCLSVHPYIFKTSTFDQRDGLSVDDGRPYLCQPPASYDGGDLLG